MRKKNTYLRLLFINISNLLNQDINGKELHPAEENYFKDILSFFLNVSNAINSWSNNRKVESNNLISLYAIPDLYNTYNNNKDVFAELVENDTEEANKFFEAIYKSLKEYYDNRKLDPKTKKLLHEFFLFLSKQYSSEYQFETVEYLSSDINFENYKLKYA